MSYGKQMVCRALSVGLALGIALTLAMVEKASAEGVCVDSDQDAEADGTDTCPQTPSGRPVDDAGCSLTQFCAGIDVTNKAGARACKKADWGNDEPLMRGRDADCRVDRRSGEPDDDVCVPVIPEPSTTSTTTSTTTTLIPTSTIDYTCGGNVCDGTCPEDLMCVPHNCGGGCGCEVGPVTTGQCSTSTMQTTTTTTTSLQMGTCAFSGAPCADDEACGIAGTCANVPTPYCFHACSNDGDCPVGTNCFFASEHPGGVCTNCADDGVCTANQVCKAPNDCAEPSHPECEQNPGSSCTISDVCVIP